MSASPRTKSRMIRTGAFIAPVLIVQGAHHMLASQPPLAATQTEVPLAAAAYTPPKATDDQIAAINRADLLSALDVEQTPFYYAPAINPTVAFQADNPIDAANFDPQSIRVSSISGSGNNTFAVINGTVCKVGDTVAKGIVVESIDPIDRTVILSAQGKPVALTLVDPLAD